MIKPKTHNNPNLQLIRGYYPLNISMGTLEIVAAPKKKQPFAVDAMAFEEDTFLILSADTKVRDPQKPLMHILTELIEIQPEIPGTVVVKGKHPCRLLAVVHDLDQEPTWQEDWIETALNNIFQEAEKRKLQSIALPFIGTLYGKLEKHRFIEILWQALNRVTPHYLKRLWIVVPKGTAKNAFEVFRSES